MAILNLDIYFRYEYVYIPIDTSLDKVLNQMFENKYFNTLNINGLEFITSILKICEVKKNILDIKNDIVKLIENS